MRPPSPVTTSPLTFRIGVAVFDDIERSADEILVNAGFAMFDRPSQSISRGTEPPDYQSNDALRLSPQAGDSQFSLSVPCFV
jgi:hypothetical protein